MFFPWFLDSCSSAVKVLARTVNDRVVQNALIAALSIFFSEPCVFKARTESSVHCRAPVSWNLITLLINATTVLGTMGYVLIERGHSFLIRKKQEGGGAVIIYVCFGAVGKQEVRNINNNNNVKLHICSSHVLCLEFWIPSLQALTQSPIPDETCASCPSARVAVAILFLIKLCAV